MYTRPRSSTFSEVTSSPSFTDIYNVLERLRAGARPDDFGPKERWVFDHGLVLILKDLHDRLDAAVAAAYGWPATLSDEDILVRLVALNRKRVEEERRGLVRWLRPDYQIPRFGSAAEKAEQLEADFGSAAGAVPTGIRTAIPKTDREQTAVVMAVLANSHAPIDRAAIAATVKPGRNVQRGVGDVLHALHRMGLVSSADGKTFALRRAA